MARRTKADDAQADRSRHAREIMKIWKHAIFLRFIWGTFLRRAPVMGNASGNKECGAF
jgi:hypothetical protein